MLINFAKIVSTGAWIIFWSALLAMKLSGKNPTPQMFVGNPKKSSTVEIIIFFTLLHTLLWMNEPVLFNAVGTDSALALSFFGFIIISIALGMGIWSLSELGKSFSATTAAPTKLITSGPYKYIRHPIYLMFILFWIGSSMMFVDAIGLSLGIILIPLILKRVKLEEANLLNVFGNDYAEYQSRTRRFFLKLR